jgi:hypothetical protein
MGRMFMGAYISQNHNITVRYMVMRRLFNLTLLASQASRPDEVAFADW